MAFRPLAAAVSAMGLCLLSAQAVAQSSLQLKPVLHDESPADPESEQANAEIDMLPVEETPPRRARQVDDPYAPQGLGAGGLRLYPSLTAGGVATSNLGRRSDEQRPDAGLRLRPALRIESDWVRHSYTATASGDVIFYADNSDLDSRDAELANTLRLDVRRGSTLEMTGRYALNQSGLEDSDVPDTAVGYQTEHTLSASAALTHDVGPLQGRLRAGLTRRTFEDVSLSGGGTQDNGDRDYIEPSVALRVTYRDAPVFKPFVEAGYTPRLHVWDIDRNGLKRDSQGYTAAAGVEIDNGPIWAGEVALAYQHRTYADGALDSNDVLGVNGSVTWSPTELTRIVAGAETSIAETTSATSSGTRNWSFTLDASQALRDNLDVSAGTGVEFSRRDGGTDVTYDASVSLSWKINPALSWTAGYDFTWLNAADGNSDYTEHRVSAGVTLSR